MAGQAQFKLRAFCHLDRIQPQFAAFVGKIASGAPPVEGESTLYVEMVPGIWVYRIVDRVLKAVDVQPSAQMVEREFGMLAVHAFSQANVLRAGEVVLEALDLSIEDRLAPRIVSEHIITNIHPSQAQVLNRDNGGTMIEGGQTLLVMSANRPPTSTWPPMRPRRLRRSRSTTSARSASSGEYGCPGANRRSWQPAMPP